MLAGEDNRRPAHHALQLREGDDRSRKGDGADSGAGSLIAATQRLLGNASERQALRMAARQEAERWGWAGATEQLRGYYRKVLQRELSPAA